VTTPVVPPSELLSYRPWARWGLLALGVACVLVGAVLTLRPFASLAALVVLVSLGLLLTGAAELVEARASGSRWSLVAGLAWVAAGVAVLVWPGVTVGVLAIVVGLALVVGGVTRVPSAASAAHGTSASPRSSPARRASSWGFSP
jgi:uncharacterized membrane protein HdeD (DUF308 family)